MKRILHFLSIFIVLSIFIFNINLINSSAASFSDGLKTTGGNIGYPETGLDTFLPATIGQIISLSLGFLGVAFLGIMIYAGYLWMMARGNEQDVEKAKNIIIYAVIGLVVVLSAYAITLIIGTLWT